MEQNTKIQLQHKHEQQHQNNVEHNRRDDLTWTQYITNLAARKLAPPKSQTLKVLEDHLLSLSEELYLKRGDRIGDRIESGPGQGDKRDSQGLTINSTGDGTRQKGPGTAGTAQPAGALDNVGSGDIMRLAEGPAKLEYASFKAPNAPVPTKAALNNLNQQLHAGSNWINILWQFIVKHQRRIVDPERLGIEPSERMDIQVEIIRQIAASYDKLSLLTHLPASLGAAKECKIVDDIRTMALVYVARSIMDVASPEEIALEDGDDEEENQKHLIAFPRSVISPYEGIEPIEFDPMDLLAVA